MYDKQKKFQELIMQTYNIADKEKFLKDLLIHLNAETFEVLNEMNWKMHKRAIKTVDEKKILYEMVDVIKYAISLPGTWGFTSAEVERAFDEKTKIVEQKFMQEIINKDFSQEDKVVGVDIDGVLMNYPESFLEFAAKELNLRRSILEFKQKTYNLYDEFAEFSGISKEQLKDLKHRYRVEGHKQDMKPIIGAAQFIKNLRMSGYKVILLSARPVSEYENIFYDTIISLNRAGIEFDGLYFSENKEVEILKKFPNIKFFIEDNYDNAEKISILNKKVFLIDKCYNKIEKRNDNIVRVDYLHEIFTLMEE